MDIIEKIQKVIEQKELIPDGARVIVGVSGGADSVALLHILHRLGYPIAAAHLNHSIRGAEADADEQFVKDLCAKLGVECVTEKTDVPALAKEKGISLEMAARDARHEFFRSLTSDLRPLTSDLRPLTSDLRPLTSDLRPPTSGLRPPTSVICLAHHADDQLETFFLRAARGTGPSGLGGMRAFQCLEANVDAFAGVTARASSRQPCNVVGQASLYSESLCLSQNQENTRSLREARPTMPCEVRARLMLIRPMLGIRRSEIFQWLEKNKIDWREDASNADETIPRNLVRHQLLPLLGKINERAAENILRTMAILRDEEEHPKRAAARREARDRLIEFGVPPTFEAVEQFIEFSARKEGTSYLDLEGVRLVNEYGILNVGQASSLPGQPGRPPHIRMEEGAGILRGKREASVSLEKIAGREVIVRMPQPGDRMNPFGMEGSKKLQDIFTDLKIPQQRREGWPVVVCDGEIIWIPGYRIARGWELSGDSEPALHLFFD